jgi:hypothetical protein
MQATTVREALRASLAGTFGTVLSVLPRLIVFAIALAVGWAISSLLARATIAALRAVRFGQMAHRSGLAGFIEKMGVRQDPTGVVASISKWLVRVATLVVALDVLGLPAGSGALHQLLLWLPNLAVALVALVIGGVAATALSRLVQGAATVAGLPNPHVLATATSIAVWAFAVVVAVSQLGIATPVVNLALVGVVGGVALAAGLAFGWAGRDRAAQLLSLLDDRYGSRPVAAPGASTPSPATVPTVSTFAPATAFATSAAPPEAARARSGSDRADFASAPVADPTAPVLDPSAPVPDPSAPTLEVSAPEFEGAAPEFEGVAPEFEGVAPEFEETASQHEEVALEFEGMGPEFEGVVPEFEAAEPEVEAAAPMLDKSGPELALFPEDEPASEPARIVPFEESWIPRSGVDRRRIPRPGPDRRAGVF